MVQNAAAINPISRRLLTSKAYQAMKAATCYSHMPACMLHAPICPPPPPACICWHGNGEGSPQGRHAAATCLHTPLHAYASGMGKEGGVPSGQAG